MCLSVLSEVFYTEDRSHLVMMTQMSPCHYDAAVKMSAQYA